jgi:uncharacterized delta-60 repeat protein
VRSPRTSPRIAIAAAIALVVLVTTAAQAAPGDLDPSFGGDGRVSTHVDVRYAGANAIALQADGKVVAVGTASSRAASFLALVRYDTDGSLDPSFGGDGRVTETIGNGKCVLGSAVAIQGDSKIVVAGRSGCRDGRFALARFETNGTLDTTFGGDGVVTTRFGSTSCDAEAFGVAIQGDGAIVAAGRANCREARFAAARYGSDGALDQTFGGDGRVTTDVARRWDVASAVALQVDGKIVLAGTASIETDRSRFAVIRYAIDGTLDPTFGGDGIVTTPPQDCIAQGKALAIQPDGRIVVGGFDGCIDRFAVARYRVGGHLDTSFGGDGTVTTAFPCPQSDAEGVAVQPDGSIVAAGSAVCEAHRDIVYRFAAARYGSDGTLDAAFGSRGTVVTPFSCQGLGHAVAVQGDGGIVVAGGLLCDVGTKFAVVRYLGA